MHQLQVSIAVLFILLFIFLLYKPSQRQNLSSENFEISTKLDLDRASSNNTLSYLGDQTSEKKVNDTYQINGNMKIRAEFIGLNDVHITKRTPFPEVILDKQRNSDIEFTKYMAMNRIEGATVCENTIAGISNFPQDPNIQPKNQMNF